MGKKIILAAVFFMPLCAVCLAQRHPIQSDGLVCISMQGGAMKLVSPSFQHNKSIPAKFTCDGQDINPALSISGIPPAAKTLALIVDDPDAPMGTWVHWVVYNISPTPEIKEKSIPGTQGKNDFDRKDYGGPCPPSGEHRYLFKVYALDAELNLQGVVTKAVLEKAMQGHILDKAALIGLYRRGS